MFFGFNLRNVKGDVRLEKFLRLLTFSFNYRIFVTGRCSGAEGLVVNR